jgi:hypothetical protein
MRLKGAILSSLTALCILSCNEPSDPDIPEKKFEAYVIPAGHHSSFNSLEWLEEKDLSYEVYFDSSAIYSTQDSSNQADINKLFGFSDCGGHHHENSARFGWRWFQNELQIFSYIYVDQDRMYDSLTSVELGAIHSYRVLQNDSMYLFYMDEIEIARYARHSNCTEGWNYRLWPYFGGDEAAPHDITIWMRELD